MVGTWPMSTSTREAVEADESSARGGVAVGETTAPLLLRRRIKGASAPVAAVGMGGGVARGPCPSLLAAAVLAVPLG